MRIDLAGTQPALWRQLDLASDLHLGQLHDVIQTSFGWLDYHLHRFADRPHFVSEGAKFYLCEFEVSEGERGTPEERVWLDQVLTRPGDQLFYLYDFGDDWEHVITLEATLPRSGDEPRAVCVDGERHGPPEDCGGVHGLELITAAADPAHPRHAEASAEFARIYGNEVDPAGYVFTPFDPAKVTESLAVVYGAGGGTAAELPPTLGRLADQIRHITARREFLAMVSRALSTEPQIAPDRAAGMVYPYRWFLAQVGTDGIMLTAAGYLPPAVVHLAWTELGLADEWIGKGNREDLTWPVLEFRESVQKLGLIRKNRGRLLLTARGRHARSDPVTLWWLLAERLPLDGRSEFDTHAALALLVAMADGIQDGWTRRC